MPSNDDLQFEIKGIKKTLFGEDGLGGLTKEMAKRATWMFFWIVFSTSVGFFLGGFAYLGLEINSKASASDITELRKIQEEQTRNNIKVTIELRNLIKTLEKYTETNERDHAKIQEDIKKIRDEIKNARKR